MTTAKKEISKTLGLEVNWFEIAFLLQIFFKNMKKFLSVLSSVLLVLWLLLIVLLLLLLLLMLSLLLLLLLSLLLLLLLSVGDKFSEP